MLVIFFTLTILTLTAGNAFCQTDEQLGLHSEVQWWHEFRERSYIHLGTGGNSDRETVFNLARGYALQRYINAGSGRGNSPIKFNGTIFTVDTENMEGRWQGFDADYRQWGGPYWWQNTRPGPRIGGFDIAAADVIAVRWR